jgi:hypothetical protein
LTLKALLGFILMAAAVITGCPGGSSRTIEESCSECEGYCVDKEKPCNDDTCFDMTEAGCGGSSGGCGGNCGCGSEGSGGSGGTGGGTGSTSGGSTVSGDTGGSVKITIGFDYGDISVSGSDGKNVISGSQTLTLSVSGYENILWYVDVDSDDTVLDDMVLRGNPLTLRADAYLPGDHVLTFNGYRDGRPYSKRIPFKVAK